MTMALRRTLRNWALFLWVAQTIICANVIDSYRIQLEDSSGRMAAALAAAAEEEMSGLASSVDLQSTIAGNSLAQSHSQLNSPSLSSSPSSSSSSSSSTFSSQASPSSYSSSSSSSTFNSAHSVSPPISFSTVDDTPTPVFGAMPASNTIDHSSMIKPSERSVNVPEIIPEPIVNAGQTPNSVSSLSAAAGTATATATGSTSIGSIMANGNSSLVIDTDRIFPLYPIPNDCIFVKTEDGIYSFVSAGKSIICGLYFIAKPEYLVEIEFLHFDISCGQSDPSGLLSVVDGWELSGQFFPGIQDHEVPREARYHEFCGPIKPRKKFRLSQNAGLIEYRIPTPGQGFVVRVKFVENPKPCNVIIQDFQGEYTLRNYGRRINCTVSLIFDISFTILSMNVGGSYRPLGNMLSSRNYVVETGIIKKCKKRGKHDYIEFLGGKGLDPHAMTVAEDICGVRSLSLKKKFTVACPHSAVRLVSSGKFDNAFHFTFDALSSENVPSLICPDPFK